MTPLDDREIENAIVVIATIVIFLCIYRVVEWVMR